MKTGALFGSLTTSLALYLQAQAQTPFTTGLVAFYTFSGNVNDISGNGNNGSIIGNDRKFAFDRFAEPTNSIFLNTTSAPAWNLDGAYVSAPRSASLDFNADFSLSLWVNLSSGSG